MSTTSPITPDRSEPRGRLTGLWLGLLGPAVVWLTQFQVNYTLVPWVCVHGHAIVLRIVSAVAVLLAVVFGLIAWGNWKAVGASWPSQDSDIDTRTRFMAALGVMSSGFFLLIILGQALAQAFIDPCRM